MNDQPKKFPKPVDWDELYCGRFIKCSDLKGKNVTLQIASVDLEELVGEKGPQKKGVIAFQKTDKNLALNRTNGVCIKAMFGKKVQAWVGKRITLMPAQWNGDDAIRIFGSPDLAEDMPVTVALPRRRPFEMVMHAVRTGAQKPTEPSEPPPPASDDNTEGTVI